MSNFGCLSLHMNVKFWENWWINIGHILSMANIFYRRNVFSHNLLKAPRAVVASVVSAKRRLQCSFVLRRNSAEIFVDSIITSQPTRRRRRPQCDHDSPRSSVLRRFAQSMATPLCLFELSRLIGSNLRPSSACRARVRGRCSSVDGRSV